MSTFGSRNVIENVQITFQSYYSGRHHVKRLMTELRTKGVVSLQKAGRHYKWLHPGS